MSTCCLARLTERSDATLDEWAFRVVGLGVKPAPGFLPAAAAAYSAPPAIDQPSLLAPCKRRGCYLPPTTRCCVRTHLSRSLFLVLSLWIFGATAVPTIHPLQISSSPFFFYPFPCSRATMRERAGPSSNRIRWGEVPASRDGGGGA